MSTLIPEWETPAPSRRTFIRTTTATAAGALLGGLPAGAAGPQHDACPVVTVARDFVPGLRLRLACDDDRQRPGSPLH